MYVSDFSWTCMYEIWFNFINQRNLINDVNDILLDYINEIWFKCVNRIWLNCVKELCVNAIGLKCIDKISLNCINEIWENVSKTFHWKHFIMKFGKLFNEIRSKYIIRFHYGVLLIFNDKYVIIMLLNYPYYWYIEIFRY